ncbi:hypothetical protein CF326_g4817 [Tilletia indica]|nr:hypothetical protein CF326_g4817 [Tilletia indica]
MRFCTAFTLALFLGVLSTATSAFPTDQVQQTNDLASRANCGCIKQVPGGLEPCCPKKRGIFDQCICRRDPRFAELMK